MELIIAHLLSGLESYRDGALAAYGEARQLAERALAIRETALGPDHPETATSLNNLAGLLYAQGDVAAARPLLERALAIRETALGPDHPDTLAVVGNLAGGRCSSRIPTATRRGGSGSSPHCGRSKPRSASPPGMTANCCPA